MERATALQLAISSLVTSRASRAQVAAGVQAALRVVIFDPTPHPLHQVQVVQQGGDLQAAPRADLHLPSKVGEGKRKRKRRAQRRRRQRKQAEKAAKAAADPVATFEGEEQVESEVVAMADDSAPLPPQRELLTVKVGKGRGGGCGGSSSSAASTPLSPSELWQCAQRLQTLEKALPLVQAEAFRLFANQANQGYVVCQFAYFGPLEYVLLICFSVD